MKISNLGRLPLLAALLCALQATAAEFFVATNGSDQNPGTADQPVATLRHARDLARQSHDHAKRITIQPGTYYNVSVRFGPEDSGLVIEGSSLGKVTLVGGQAITEWSTERNGWLAAKLPPYPLQQLDFPTGTKNWEIRTMALNGQWRPWSRYPKSGYLTNLNQWTASWGGTMGGGWGRQPTTEEVSTLKYRPGDIPEGISLKSTEITTYHVWDASFGRVSSNDVVHGILHFAPRGSEPQGAFAMHDYVLWNTPFGMTHPGQWYHNHEREAVLYFPRPDESPLTIHAIVPAAITIIGLIGTDAQPVQGIKLKNLNFESTTVTLGSGGTLEMAKDGAIELKHAEQCLLAGLAVRCVGGWGIKAEGKCKMTVVEQCSVQNCGAGGIAIAGAGSHIQNNTVEQAGLMHPAGGGIVLQGSDGEIISNRVENCSYAAIAASGGRQAVIAWNAVSNAMTFLHDGGAIYLSKCTNYYIHNNFVTATPETSRADAWAIYLDEHTFGAKVEHNLVTLSPCGFHAHFSFTNLVKNNIFSSPKDLTLSFPRCNELTFEDNILVAPNRLNIGAPEKGQFWHRNVLTPVPETITWSILNGYTELRREAAPPEAFFISEAAKEAAKKSRPAAAREAAKETETPPFQIPRPEAVGRQPK